jgi:7-cyano-7-deazaguanine synthase in queuosine biosynthesis
MRRRKRNQDKTFEADLPSEAVIRKFATPTLSGLNALTIGTAVFQAEQRLRTAQFDKLVIPYYQPRGFKYDVKSLRRLIHELIVFTLVEDIAVELRPVVTQLSLDFGNRSDERISNVCLFSGGTDSYAGLLLAREVLGEVRGVFCAHSDQSRIIKIVNQLENRIFSPRGIPVSNVPAPPMNAGGYAQVRGFLYLLSATAVASRLSAKRIVVTECGPTMYQPRFGPLDSITMTTHPFVVRTAAKVATLLLQRDVSILTPSENLTKAEVVAVSPEKDGLRHTHSCISQRFGSHDGTCYGCVIRRLATLAADVRDVKYNKNPIADSNANSANLYALLNFSFDVLTDFESMEEYEVGMINEYGKKDLFRRFALDNFAAIHQLRRRNKRIVLGVRQMYEALVAKIGYRILDRRLGELTQPTIRPNFRRIAA